MALIDLIQRWVHRRRGHRINTARTTPWLFDITAKGILHRCSCGEVWAQ